MGLQQEIQLAGCNHIVIEGGVSFTAQVHLIHLSSDQPTVGHIIQHLCVQVQHNF